jgi:hypothetical protein
MLYGFKRAFLLDSYSDSIFFSLINSRPKGAGTAIVLLNALGQRQVISTDLPDDGIELNPVTNSNIDLNAIANQIRKSYQGRALNLNAKSKKEVTITTDIPPGQLLPGEYQFYLIFFSGPGVSEIIGAHQLAIDRKINGCEVLNGWVKSNLVKLIVGK